MVGVGQVEHGRFVPCEVFPFFRSGEVDRADLPALKGRLEAAQDAFILGSHFDGEPELDEHDAIVRQHFLHIVHLLHELIVLGPGAEAHCGFHYGPVVPAPVKEDHLASIGQALEVPLEVPLPPLPFCRFAEGYRAVVARVQELRKTENGTALPGCVPPFENNEQPEFLLVDVQLEFEHFHLEEVQLIDVLGVDLVIFFDGASSNFIEILGFSMRYRTGGKKPPRCGVPVGHTAYSL